MTPIHGAKAILRCESMSTTVILCLSLILMACSSCMSADSDWRVPLDMEAWKVNSTGTVQQGAGAAALEARVTGKTFTDGSGQYSLNKAPGGITFTVAGVSAKRKMMEWISDDASVDVSAYQYITIRYKVRYLARGANPLAAVSVNGTDSKGDAVGETILNSSQMITDGRWHVLVQRKTLPMSVKSVKVSVYTDNPRAELTLGDVRFSENMPEDSYPGNVKAEWTGLKGPMQTFHALDLSSMFNKSYNDALAQVLARSGVVDGMSRIPSARISVSVYLFVPPASRRYSGSRYCM